MNFQLKMLTHQLDECKYRFWDFDGAFGGNKAADMSF